MARPALPASAPPAAPQTAETPRPDQPRLTPPRFGAVRTITALILRDMNTTYGRSPGGYVWAVLESVGIILILSLTFSFVVRTPSLGTSFILFYATGWLSFGFYTEVEGKTRRTLRSVSTLMAYPRVTWLDAVLGRTLLASLTEATTMVLVFGGILLLVDTHVSLSMPPILTALALAWLLGLGVGLIDCLLSGLFQLWAIAWGIITRPLMIASGVLFVYDDLPRGAQDILWWNPLMHVTGLFRTGFYDTYDAAYVSLPYVFGLGLTLTMLGLIFMRAWYKLVLEA